MFNFEKYIIPKPQKINSIGSKITVAEFGKCGYEITRDSDDDLLISAEEHIRKKLHSLAPVTGDGSATFKIEIKVDAAASAFSDIGNKSEAYYVNVECGRAELCGIDPAGAFYAAVTFAEMLFDDGEDKVCAEQAMIVDYPDFPRRGHFIESRYGTEFLTRENWYDFIDYMAGMKINSITIGVYGCWGFQYDSRRMEYFYVPISKYPELNTPKNIKYYSVKDGKWVHKDNLLPYMYENDSLGDVIRYAKKKNVLVKPLINSLGHNTLIPRLMPEIAAKKEGGEPMPSGFCTRTEKTYEVLFNIYDEIIDRHLIPNGIYDIHVGLDEVVEKAICHCEACNGVPHSELMVDHIIRIAKHLKEKGMKHIYIYHDMLYHHFNVVNEELRDRFIKEDIYDEIIIDWWTYEDPKHLFWDKADGVNNLFHSVIKPDTGYYNWTLPTENNENIRACAKMAERLGFLGMETYSSFEYSYDKNYRTLADVAWNNSTIDEMPEFNERYAYRYYPKETGNAVSVFNGLFDAMRDETGEMYMNRACYKFDYYFYCYRLAGLELKDFPGGAFKLISDSESIYVPYLEYLKQKAMPAVEFFENTKTPSKINRMWLLTAKQYYVLADEYLTIWGLYKSYNAKLTSADDVIRELGRLIVAREELMLLAEEVRIPATSYTYLRNMSVFRQFMLDLLEYFKKEASEGRRPILDVLDLGYVASEKFKFLR